MAHDSALTAATLGYAAATMFGSAVAIRHDIPGEPLGLHVPITVPRGLAVGLGAGTAIPWIMAAAAAGAAFTSRAGDRFPARVCIALGISSFLGTLVEPVTWRRRTWSRDIAATVVLNLSASIALVSAGRHGLICAAG